MPQNKSAIRRYRIIDNCINNTLRPYPTLKNLADKCSDLIGIEISTSTIEKDIAFMKQESPDGLDAPIVYSKLHRGYVYSEKGFSIMGLNLQDEEWEALNFASQLLYQYKDVPVFANFKTAIERINTRFSLGFTTEDPILNKSVEFEHAVEAKGMEWINHIYGAIKHKYTIKFTYWNIYKKETKQYSLVPYLLKEHHNRWYVIGWSNEREDYLTFALDRLSDLHIIAEKTRHRSDFHAETFFQFATGIMEGNSKPIEVQLKIKDPISQLVLLEPLHHSQKLASQHGDYIKISVTVLANEEFYLKLLSLGNSCTVIKPLSLQRKMKAIIESMLSNYIP